MNEQKLCKKDIWEGWYHHICNRKAKFKVSFKGKNDVVYVCGIHAKLYKRCQETVEKIEPYKPGVSNE